MFRIRKLKFDDKKILVIKCDGIYICYDSIFHLLIGISNSSKSRKFNENIEIADKIWNIRSDDIKNER